MEDSTLTQVQDLALHQQHRFQQALVAVQQLEQDRLRHQQLQQALAEAALEAHLSQPR